MPLSDNPMTGLQNRWYNTVVKSLGADASAAQLIQPVPLAGPSDASLWAIENTIPPVSLTFNRQIVQGGSFFAEYSAVVGVLSRQGARGSGTGPDTGMERSDDPPRYAGGIKELRAQLAASPSARISFSSDTAKSDVSKTWTRGVNTNFFGLWAGAGCLEPTTAKFAADTVTVEANVGTYVVWTATPDSGWYDSGLLHAAYSTHADPPWKRGRHPDWADMFDVRKGRLRRVTAALLVVDGLRCTVTSHAVFSPDDQRALGAKAPAGVWPFFVPSGEGVANKVAFDGEGKLTVETSTSPGRPLVIGAYVLDIARYLGE